MKRRLLKIIKVTLVTVISLAVLLFIVVQVVWQDAEFGGEMDAESLLKAKASGKYIEGSFTNTPRAIPSDLSASFKEFMGNQVRKPDALFPVETPQINDSVSSTLKAIWFGHASVYLEMEGKRIMTDPMLSTHAFPVKWLAPQRYNPPPMQLEALPAIDFVTISHDHFDHLDMKTIKTLAKKGTLFFVGIGIKAHLVAWNIPDTQIYEMDWWEAVTIGEFKIRCTPARHYSGRKLMNKATLWASWVIESPNYSVFHSGDSGYNTHFKEIGKKFGPFDMGFIKIGDYGEDKGWRDIHMHTEYSVQAAKDVKANIMFPIHWGTFALSYHDWFEPINLAVRYAKAENVTLVTPKLGQTISVGEKVENEMWWKALEPQTIKK